MGGGPREHVVGSCWPTLAVVGHVRRFTVAVELKSELRVDLLYFEAPY
jgi:hypothetical protein